MCECRSAGIHIPCLADVVWSGHDACSVCLAPWDEGTYIKALEVLLDRAETVDDRVKCHLNLGTSLIKAGVFKEGVADVQASLDLQPCAEAWLALAEASLDQGQLEEAVQRLTAAFDLVLDGRAREDQRKAYSRLAALWGSTRLAQGRLDEAEASLRASLDNSRYAGMETVVFALRTLSRLMEVRGREQISMHALAAVSEVVEKESGDPACRAVAAAELGIKEVALGVDATDRLRSALKVLRRRPHGGSEDLVSRARLSLGVLPAKRLRRRTHPEDI